MGLIMLLLCCCSRQQEKKFESMTFDETKLPTELVKIDDKIVSAWSNKLDTNYFEYFEFKHLDGQFNPIVIKVSGDDYSALRLLTFDDNERLISDYEISGGPCGGPTELEDKIEFCPSRISRMTSPTTFLVKTIQEFYEDWDDSKPSEVDSTQWKIEIDQHGQIVVVR